MSRAFGAFLADCASGLVSSIGTGAQMCSASVGDVQGEFQRQRQPVFLVWMRIRRHAGGLCRRQSIDVVRYGSSNIEMILGMAEPLVSRGCCGKALVQL